MIRNMPACAVQKRIVQLTEGSASAVGERAVDEGVQYPGDLRVGSVDFARVVGRHDLFKLLYPCAEDVVVFYSGFLGYFNVCAVVGSERYGAVEHELHVSGAGRLGARGGNLFGNICGCNQLFSVGNVVVLNEYNVDKTLHGRVGIYERGNFIDVLDDGLGAGVSGCGLRAEDERCRVEILDAAVLYPEVDVHYRERVQKLALVFVQALYLDIENAVGVDSCAIVLCDVLGECGFLRGLYAAEPVKLSGVAGVFLKFFQAGEVGYPAFVAEEVGDLRGKLRVAERYPAARRDTVRLVLEAFRIQLIPLGKRIVLEYLGVDTRNSVGAA